MINSIYCLKCQKKTPTINVKRVVLNGRHMLQVNCKVCGSKKSQYIAAVKGQSGKGAADNFISMIPKGVELHLLGSIHKEPYQANDKSLVGVKEGTRKMEYTGSNTKTDERYAKGERGINDLDHAAMAHDFAYKSKDPKVRNAADVKLYHAAEKYLGDKKNLTLLDKADANIVKLAMRVIKRKE